MGKDGTDEEDVHIATGAAYTVIDNRVIAQTGQLIR